ncbi:MAG: Uma2 family endonuclease [Verrucomicrobiales bacterium]|nr:Uma2 family endonuclease [Verrucomicrobiales bacterium]
MNVVPAEKQLSEAEFLERERRAEVKSEFFDGEVFAMAGGTREHSLIAMNLGGELRSQLKSKPCLRGLCKIT